MTISTCWVWQIPSTHAALLLSNRGQGKHAFMAFSRWCTRYRWTQWSHRLNVAFWEVKMVPLRYHTHRAKSQALLKSSGLSQFSLSSLSHSLSFSGSCERETEWACDTLLICIRLHLSSLFLACNCNQIFVSLRGHEDDFALFLIYAPPYDLPLPSPPLTASFLALWANAQMTFRNYECHWPPRRCRKLITEIAERKIQLNKWVEMDVQAAKLDDIYVCECIQSSYGIPTIIINNNNILWVFCKS